MSLPRLAVCLVCFNCFVSASYADELTGAEAADFFERKVRPLLVEKCQTCHGEKKSRGNLRFLSREAILEGGDSGPAAVSRKPEESLLVQAIEYDGDLRMPPDAKLANGDIEILKRWVALGLPWPQPPVGTIPEGTVGASRWSAEQRQWWSFQPLRPVGPRTVPTTAPIRNAIDQFLQAQIDKAGLQPFPPAEKRVLIRRATFDLTGLPPTPEEIDAFVNDNSPDAFARVVDRLLQSPQYGERWARHWLDLVRYADYFEEKPGSHGSAAKFELWEAWKYRDWVAESFQRDRPYDEFLMLQIAGDRISGPDGEPPSYDNLIATSVLAIGSWDNGDADKDKIVADIVDDQIDVIGQAFLGITLACARCHDHKFDPVSTKDYYGLAGIFYSSHVLETVGTKGDHTVLLRTPLAPADYVARRKQQTDRLAQLKAEIDKLQQAAKTAAAGSSATGAATPATPGNESSLAQLAGERAALEKDLLPDPPKALAIQEGGTPGGIFTGIQDVPVHIRGSHVKLGQVVPRHLPEFFAGAEQPPIGDGSGRPELARWVASPSNPLTARVMANRIWQAHFGEGLVRTPNNFGKLGEKPTHPELLDWLAVEFIQSGWSVKALHRLIMNSAAYQRASAVPADSKLAQEVLARDPENRLWARFPSRRLDAESLRDAMLAASGRLDLARGGPAGPDLNSPRRSLYVQTTRWQRAHYSTLFDAADPDQSVGKRNTTAVAPQALFFLNHPFVQLQAGQFAQRLLIEAADTPARLSRASRLLYGRLPTEAESAVAAEFFRVNATRDVATAWTDFLQVLFASNEFAYVD
jgi:hypothetical protein